MTMPKSIDITAPEGVEILIREDGKVIWVNVVGSTPELDSICVLRCCQIGQLIVIDKRFAPEDFLG